MVNHQQTNLELDLAGRKSVWRDNYGCCSINCMASERWALTPCNGSPEFESFSFEKSGDSRRTNWGFVLILFEKKRYEFHCKLEVHLLNTRPQSSCRRLCVRSFQVVLKDFV